MKFINIWLARVCNCGVECEAKQIVRNHFEQFDEEQKIQMTHNLCHQVGLLVTVLKYVGAIFLVVVIGSIFSILR